MRPSKMAKFVKSAVHLQGKMRVWNITFPKPVCNYKIPKSQQRKFHSCKRHFSKIRPPPHASNVARDSFDMALKPTKLDYFDDMQKLGSTATILSFSQGEDGRHALVLDSTIFYPQGGGQPSDTGFVTNLDMDSKFIIQDVRSKGGIVFHYGIFDTSQEGDASKLENGQEVRLYVDGPRRKLNSRLHSAGHLLDICMHSTGLSHLEPVKGYHFPEGPFVEYKGSIPQNELQSRQKELETAANALLSNGGKVSAVVLPYEEASQVCGGSLPTYIPKESTPRIVKLGNQPGCPCGGTHVSDISDIGNLKVSQIRVKKGLTKVFYSIEP